MNRWIQTLLDWLTDRQTRQHPYPTTSFGARLPSSLPEAYFQATVHVTWPPRREGLSPGLIAKAEQQLRGTLSLTVRQHSVLHVAEAETAVNLALNNSLRLTDAGIQVLAAEAALTAEPAGAELAEQYEALQRDTALATATQHAQVDRLRVLGDHILIDPTLARLWWLDGKPEKLPEMVKMNKVFEDAATLLTARGESSRTNPIAELIQTFLHDLTPGHRELLLKQLQQIFLAYERADLADLIKLPATSSASTWGTDSGQPTGGHNGYTQKPETFS